MLPPDIFENVDSARQPSLKEKRELALKARLYVDDDNVVLLVRAPTKLPSTNSPRSVGRAARLLNDEPVRIYCTCVC